MTVVERLERIARYAQMEVQYLEACGEQSCAMNILRIYDDARKIQLVIGGQP